MHSSHLEYPSVDRNSIHATLLPLLDRKDNFDLFIILTPSQADDFVRSFDLPKEKVLALPHPQVAVPDKVQQNIDYYSHKVSMVARYHPAKNIGEAIEAFRIVVDSVSDAELRIYGYGPERDSLQSKIAKLGLERNVHLEGFLSDPNEAYLDSYLTLLTSQYEGQGLVIGESMAMGVPVIAYDVNYGPRDVIRDGVDGILVKKHDRKSLAEAIIVLFQEKDKRREMSLAAREVSSRFSVDTFAEKLTAKLSESIR